MLLNGQRGVCGEVDCHARGFEIRVNVYSVERLSGFSRDCGRIDTRERGCYAIRAPMKTDERIITRLRQMQKVTLLLGLLAGQLTSGHAQSKSAAASSDAIALIPFSQVWRYEASGKDLGSAWKEGDFDDASWASGSGPLGFETTPEKLSMPLGTAFKSKGVITYYFRTTFNFAAAHVGFDLVGTNLLDDGAVFYLNGAEIWRSRLPSGSIQFNTAASSKVDNARFTTISVPTLALVNGTNVLAVEVHQSDKGSSDLVMGTSLWAQPVVPTALSFIRQPANQTVRELEPASLVIEVKGRGACFQWFRDNAAIPGQNQARLTISRVRLADAGSYMVVASNAVNSVTSRAAKLLVTPGQPPVIVQPPADATAAIGESVSLKAEVEGDQPFYYQWFKDKMPLPAETNQTLTVTRPFLSDSGQYSLVVSNLFGQTTSPGVTLTIRRHPLGQLGSVDRNFIPNPTQPVRTLVVQDGGNLVIGGSFETVNQVRRKLLARLQSDGSLDTGFAPSIKGLASPLVEVVKQLADGKLLVGGVFSEVAKVPRQSLARLNPDGSLDASFDPAPESPQWVRDLALQSDGKLIVVGGSGPGDAELVRLHNDGSLDQSFAVGTGASYFTSVAVQTDGKLLVGGVFRQIGGHEQHYIARFNRDGSLDDNFLPGRRGPDSVVRCLTVNANKILVGGNFTSIDGLTCQGLARLNLDGTLDTSFTPPDISGGAFGVDSVLELEDGKLLVMGDFTTVGGVARKGLARLLPNGALDSTFEVGSGAGSGYDRVRCAALTANGDILIAGHFTSFNGVPQRYLARLTGR